MLQIVVVGGSDAGVSAALRAKETSPDARVDVISADDHPNLSICGLPFYVGGEVPDWRSLAHRTADDLRAAGLRLHLKHQVHQIDREQRAVFVKTPMGEDFSLSYDRLVIATGAVPRCPDIPGLDLPGVFTLRWLEDAWAIRDYVEREKVQDCIILGGGYIGIEMAEAFSRLGLQTTLIEKHASVLPDLGPVPGRQVQQELERRGVRVIPQQVVTGIERRQGRLLVAGADGFMEQAQLVLAALGVRPAPELAAASGFFLGPQGAIQVNRRMETNVPGVYACAYQ
jgi:NADPH-dependent 2,4-dienoyl-CoA reductase/sulfur reductase-like enzyme